MNLKSSTCISSQRHVHNIKELFINIQYDFSSYQRLGDLLSVVEDQALGCGDQDIITWLFLLVNHLSLLNTRIVHAVEAANNSILLQSSCKEFRASLAEGLLLNIENIDSKALSNNYSE